jgi:hypothetical protein
LCQGEFLALRLISVVDLLGELGDFVFVHPRVILMVNLERESWKN